VVREGFLLYPYCLSGKAEELSGADESGKEKTSNGKCRLPHPAEKKSLKEREKWLSEDKVEGGSRSYAIIGWVMIAKHDVYGVYFMMKAYCFPISFPFLVTFAA